MLRRLRTGYLDVYFAHIDDQEIPLDEPLTACARVVASGKEIASQRVVILVSRSRCCAEKAWCKARSAGLLLRHLPGNTLNSPGLFAGVE